MLQSALQPKGTFLGYSHSLHFSGRAAEDDVRCWVTLKVDELSNVPLRFYFLRWVDDCGARGFEYVGHSFGADPVTRKSLHGIDLEGHGSSAEQARWLKVNLRPYQAMAERLMSHDRDGARRIYSAIAKKTSLKRERGRKWSPEELTLIAETVDVLERGGLEQQEIALSLGMHRSTVYRVKRRVAARVSSRP